MKLFHSLGFMLASPVASVEEALGRLRWSLPMSKLRRTGRLPVTARVKPHRSAGQSTLSLAFQKR